MNLLNLYHGDCLDIMPSLPDKSIDMILCDLPYGSTSCKWDIVIPFIPLWEQYRRIIKDNGCIALFGTEPFSSYLRLSNIKWFRYDWIWDKVKGTGFLNANKRPIRNHEIISIFYKKQCLYNPQKTAGHVRKVSSAAHKRNSKVTENYGSHGLTGYDSTERYPRSIQVFSSDIQHSALHPTQKPVALCEYLIRTYTREGELVLDNCAGSGTTGVACRNTGRGFIGIEKEINYFNIAHDRILSDI